MIIKKLENCKEFIANDNSILRQLLHPDKINAEISYSLAHAIVKPKQKTLPHILSTSEVYYILQGAGIMYINDEMQNVKVGDVIYIPPNAVQFIENTQNYELKFLCIVDPAWQLENEKIL